jgi:DNA invertase Pin-like site-specific DNA recombinase
MPTNLQALAQVDPGEARKRLRSALDVAGTVDLAARMLGVSRRTLYRVAEKLGVPVGLGKANEVTTLRTSVRGQVSADPDKCPPSAL